MKSSNPLKNMVDERMGLLKSSQMEQSGTRTNEKPDLKIGLVPLVEKWRGETEFWKKKASVSFNDEKKVALAFSSAIRDCLEDLKKAIAETENTSNND